MRCRFTRINARLIRCRVCSREWGTTVDPDTVNAMCRQKLPFCTMLAEEVREVFVKACNGRTIGRSVMGCVTHGECVPIYPTPDGMACCESCGDYQAQESGPP